MYTTIKNILDLIAALIAVVILLPLGLLICLLLWIFQGGSPFFFQDRVGKGDRIFRVIKFRTMSTKKGPDGKLLPDAQRMTKIGKLVRSSSLDELPQLINVLKGDMSFVGPRPLLVKYLPLYSKEQARRHEVKPGITGWAQVNGRNSLSWEKKFELDVWYVDHISFLLDMRIFWMTFVKVIRREGVNSSQNVTMAPFRGSGDINSNA